MKQKTLSPWVNLEIYALIAIMLWIRFCASENVQALAVCILMTGYLAVVCYYSLKLLKAHLSGNKSFIKVLRCSRALSPVWLYTGLVLFNTCFIFDAYLIMNLVSGNIQKSNHWPAAYVILSLPLGMLVWLSSYQIRLSLNKIEYWSLFGGYRSLARDEIKQARIKIGWFTYWDRFRPTFRLEILPNTEQNDKHLIIINLKVFKKIDLDYLFDWLGEKLDDPEKLTLVQPGILKIFMKNKDNDKS